MPLVSDIIRCLIAQFIFDVRVGTVCQKYFKYCHIAVEAGILDRRKTHFPLFVDVRAILNQQ